MAARVDSIISTEDYYNPFDKLPIEITQRIGSYCTYDSDLCNFRLICRSTHDSVDGDNCSFWRRRFLDVFEQSISLQTSGNLAFKKAYQKRRSVLKNGAQFRTGETRRERECLEVIRDLVVGESSLIPSSFDHGEGVLS